MAAEAAISSAVELLGELLIQKVKFQQGVEKKAELLKEELQRMQSFLKDANKKQFEDERVRAWISQIRELAQDTEDTIEMLLLNVEDANNNTSLLKRCTAFAKRMCRLDEIGDEIESIRARLESIDKSRATYGIKGLGEVSEVERRRRWSPGQKDEHLVGLGDDVEKLLRESILNEEKKGVCAAFLEGVGGIGKSTLARAIYNHPDVVDDRFDCRGWVVVSSEFTPQETIKALLFQLARYEHEKEKLREEIKNLEESVKNKLYIQEELQQMLRKQLEGKSYCIVLDEVWEKEHFKSLITAFPNQQDKRSRLLVTSGNKIITTYGEYVHKMKVLDPAKSWELLLKKANIGSKCPKELESIGRQILGKCGGLPLAISVVGGILMETHTKSGWEKVLNQINSYLGKADSNVSAILELSYQNLSPQLKSCFLCLAFFKEDATIPARRLVNIWVGQGLIQQEGNRRVDEIARGYLNELINRSMVQIEDLTIDDQVKNCRVHDLVREVCLRKAKEEIGLEIVKAEEEGISSQSSPYKPRHRVVRGKNLDSSKQNKHLRSLFLLNVDEHIDSYVETPSHYWESFQLLKTLDLDGFAFKRLPDSFRLLIGLKYLRIHRRHYEVNKTNLELPSWFNNLKNLEVLDVANEYVMLPEAPLKMEKLRQFHVDSVGGGPMKIENWLNIETMKTIDQRHWLECSSRLMADCPLRELGIDIFPGERDEWGGRVRASLEKMTNLEELELRFRRLFSIQDFIPHLHSLTVLKVRYWSSKYRCVAASVFPPNFSHLTLERCDLSEDQITELGKLPKLQFLSLYNCHISYQRWRMEVLHNGFPCVKTLSLDHMLYLDGIDIEEGGMPRLTQIQIHDCPLLQTHNLPKRIIISAA